MNISKWSWMAGIGCAAVVGTVQAQVSYPYLQFDIANVEVSPGDSFSVQVQLVIPATYAGNNVVGLNYWFATNLAGSGQVQVDPVAGGSLLNSDFPQWASEPTWPQDLNTQNTTKPDSNHEYRNPDDLGSIVADLDPGYQGDVSPYVVASFKITVGATLSPGPYPLFTTTRLAGQGYLTNGGEPTEVPWAAGAHASMTITVVPEPAEYAAVTLLTLLGLVVYRRVKSLPEGR